VAAAPAFELLAELGTDALHAHAVELADRFCAGVDIPSGGSAIVSLAVDDDAAQAMHAANIIGSVRAGRLRLSFHVSTSEQDVDHAIDVLGPHVLRG
jgi:selenocysteine lyase/cysteine desulfurase